MYEQHFLNAKAAVKPYICRLKAPFAPKRGLFFKGDITSFFNLNTRFGLGFYGNKKHRHYCTR